MSFIPIYHPEYSDMFEEWRKCVDFTTSARLVKKRGEEYLPRIQDHDDEDYIRFKKLSPCPMVAKRVSKAISGMMMRKDPIVSNDDEIEHILLDFDNLGNNFLVYAMGVLQRRIDTGRCATFIDMPSFENKSKEQADGEGARARAKFYTERNILSWDTCFKKGKEQLKYVVLREFIYKNGDKLDSDTNTVITSYRVLDIDDGKYRVRVFNDLDEKKEEFHPKKNGKYMDSIPLVIHGGVSVSESPLIDVVDTNLALYQLSAEERFGLRMAAAPTPYVFGVDPEDPKFPKYTGSGRVLGIEDTDAKTGFREFTGAGLGSVANKIEYLEDLVVRLGVQLIGDSIGNKTATQVSTEQSNTTSTLIEMVRSMSQEFTEIIKLMAEWDGINPDNLSVEFSKDFTSSEIDYNRLNALVAAYTQGVISYETLFNNLQKGEVIKANKEYEDELEDIKSTLPPSLNKDIEEI